MRKRIVSKQPRTLTTELTHRRINQRDIDFLKKTQSVSYTGTGYFVVDLDNLTAANVIEDKEKKTITILIDHAYLQAIVSYKGITVAEDTKLRKDLREAGNEYRVVKNTLLSRALETAGIEGLDHVLEGTTAIAVNSEDYVSAAKILSSFADKNKKFEIKAGFIDGKAVDVNSVKELAELPPKEVLVAKALGGLNAPITGFVTVLNGTLKGLVVALNAIAEKQGANA